MSISSSIMMGQMIIVFSFLLVGLVLAIVAIRFLLAATRLMNRKAESLEQAFSPSQGDRRREEPERNSLASD
jgi:flagellar biosynthesis/type III secretory pathway M-ring protein FliF/YscJ